MNISFSPKPSSQGEQWWTAIRNSPEVRAQTPLETRWSYPVPNRGGVSLFGILPPKGDAEQIRMLVRVRATVAPIQVVEFAVADDRPLFEGLPNHVDGPGHTRDEATETAVLDALPRVVKTYGQPAGATLARQFVDALRTLAGPALWPYYRSLNPEFFAKFEE